MQYRLPKKEGEEGEGQPYPKAMRWPHLKIICCQTLIKAFKLGLPCGMQWDYKKYL